MYVEPNDKRSSLDSHEVVLLFCHFNTPQNAKTIRKPMFRSEKQVDVAIPARLCVCLCANAYLSVGALTQKVLVRFR